MVRTLRPAEKPWIICKLGTSEKTRVIARYTNRSDADEALRFIIKATKTAGHFVVAFDVVESDE
jgi:hypothetical protein